MSLVVSFHWFMMMPHLLMLLMSGLMGVWSWMVLLALVLLVVVFMPMHLVLLGLVDSGHLDLLPPLPGDAGEACRLYCSIRGLLQTVQRTEIWGVLVALQGCTRMHVGVDNLNVLRHVSRIIDDRCTGKPFPLVNDGDLFLKVHQFVRWRGPGTAAVSKVKGQLVKVWLPWVEFVRLIVWAIMKRMLLLLLLWVVGVFIILLLLLGGWLLGLVHAGIR